MAKIIDITEKLNFEQKPQIKIKDEVLTVNNEAVAVFKMMPLLEDNSLGAVMELCKLIFNKDDRNKIESLNLSFADFTALIKNAVALMLGKDTEGEAETHATT